jgi:hypothetical protein
VGAAVLPVVVFVRLAAAAAAAAGAAVAAAAVRGAVVAGVGVGLSNGRFLYNTGMFKNNFVKLVSLSLVLLTSCQTTSVENTEPIAPSAPTATGTLQPTATIAPTATTEEMDGIQLGEEFVLARGETAVIPNTDLVIYNEGEGSEYYDDAEGNEVHIYNIKLIVNDEIVWLDDNTPEVVVGDYVIQWQVNNRLRVIVQEEN